MRLTCPACGAIASAEAWSADADARQCLRLVAELPAAVKGHVLAYLALFRPGSGRGIKWSRALKLLAALEAEIKAPDIQWQAQAARPNSVAAWGAALAQVVENPPPRLPLKSHGYLKAIAYERADEADRARERRHNADERAGRIASESRRQTQELPVKPDFDAIRREIRTGRRSKFEK